jgi:hypothetical protein
MRRRRRPGFPIFDYPSLCHAAEIFSVPRERKHGIRRDLPPVRPFSRTSMAAISSDNFGRPMGCGHGGEVSCLEGTRLLKTHSCSHSEPRLGAKSVVSGRFELGLRPQIGPAATFSTGWDVLGSPNPAWPRSNTYERSWLRSASFGHYLDFPDFLKIPVGGAPRSAALSPSDRGKWALRMNFACTEFSEVR